MSAAFDKRAEAPWNPDDEITVERRVKVVAETEAPLWTRQTREMKRMDSRLLAIARGELDPEEADPFGGLIPIYDEEVVVPVSGEWLIIDPDVEPGVSVRSEREHEEAMSVLSHVRPVLRLRPDEVMGLPVNERTAQFASQIDGRRSLAELADLCQMDELETLEIVDELLRMGAIDLK